MVKCLISGVLLVSPLLAAAHPLAVNTAKVSLRDGHVEVQAQWDVFLLLENSPTEVATMPEAELQALHQQWQDRVVRQSRLTVDGVQLPLLVTAAPSPTELRGLAAQLSAAGHDHGPQVPLRLESPSTVVAARSLLWTSPEALGPVLVTFVQPSSRLAAPGAVAGFEVLQPAGAPSGPGAGPALQPGASFGVGVLAALAAIGAAVLWLVLWLQSRKRAGV